MLEDHEIIALFYARSESAISQIAQKYGTYCHSIAFQILQNDEDAEECVNDTYFRTWRAIPPNRPLCLRTFLGRITRNLSFDIYRRRHAEKRDAGQIPLVLEELAECIPVQKGLDNALESRLLTEVLNRFLRELPSMERDIFLRRYWYVDSIKQIAKNFGISENYVAVLLHRLRKKLKGVLKKEGIAV